MKVLTDYHHGNLFHSLHLLFEKRLGFTLYRPIGMDWFTQGFFKVAEPYGNAQDTIDQYLGINNRQWDSYSNLNGDYRLEDGVYNIFDPENKIHHKAVTFEKFKEMQFDYVVASFPTHTHWQDLLTYQPNAKFIMQIGNEGQTSSATNILCSTADFVPTENQKFYRYHQEFDLSEFEYTDPPTDKKIKSFVISLPEAHLYNAFKNALPEYDFKAHGVGSPNGTVHGPLIPSLMRESMWGYHVKPADGFGHVIHKWFASGRPVITRGNYYKGKMAEPLLIDGVTCIDLDKHSFEESIELIHKFSQPNEHKKMCQNAYKRFHEVVNFDREAKEIKDWLSII